MERKAGRGSFASGPLVASRLIDEAVWIQESEVFDAEYKLSVMEMGLLPLLREFEERGLRHVAEMRRLVGLVGRPAVNVVPPRALSPSSVDTVPRVAKFLRDCEAYRRSKIRQHRTMAWLPISIDAAELVPREFDENDWQEMTFSAFTEFVAFGAVHTAKIDLVPGNSPLAFEDFVLFDRAWSRECWGVLEDDFRLRMAREFPGPGLTRSKVAYLGIWLLVPWVLGTIIYRLYGIAPGSPDFARLQDGFSQGTVARAPYKFYEEEGLEDREDFLSALRARPPALPSGFWSCRTCKV
ncbi:hypothetical protein V1515DRAFT_592641 [Lipomyces mesembrius]